MVPQTPPAPDTSLGFVVAMRASFTTANQDSRKEWIVVSRWGAGGEFLSVARTELDASQERAPIDLTPRQSAIGLLLSVPSREHGSATFLFCQRLPDGMPVAGHFVPAQGCARLTGSGLAVELFAEGRFVGQGGAADWQVEAVRAPWIGEFVEA